MNNIRSEIYVPENINALHSNVCNKIIGNVNIIAWKHLSYLLYENYFNIRTYSYETNL